ncbi:MAG: hypothetical protein VW239_00265 [Candidatus Nanopelagicales bacterium]
MKIEEAKRIGQAMRAGLAVAGYKNPTPEQKTIIRLWHDCYLLWEERAANLAAMRAAKEALEAAVEEITLEWGEGSTPKQEAALVLLSERLEEGA